MARHDEPPLSPELILRLQRTVGNRVVQRVVAARTGATVPAKPTVLPPSPPPAEEPPAPATVDVITVVPEREHHGWLFVVTRLVVWVFATAGGRLRLKGKSEET